MQTWTPFYLLLPSLDIPHFVFTTCLLLPCHYTYYSADSTVPSTYMPFLYTSSHSLDYLTWHTIPLFLFHYPAWFSFPATPGFVPCHMYANDIVPFSPNLPTTFHTFPPCTCIPQGFSCYFLYFHYLCVTCLVTWPVFYSSNILYLCNLYLD